MLFSALTSREVSIKRCVSYWSTWASTNRLQLRSVGATGKARQHRQDWQFLVVNLQSWEVPDWDAWSARPQSITWGVVTMVTSIKNGVPYVCFSCHTWSSNDPFIAFLPLNVSTLVIFLLGWTLVVVLAMAAVNGILFARGSPPNRSNWAKNRQCSNTQSERTDTQPTGDGYNERFFELRSAVVSIPTTTADSLYLAPYDGCQDTEHTGRNCRVFGASIRQPTARMKRIVTHKTA